MPDTPPTDTQLVPLDTTLAAAADVRRLDLQAMYNKATGILATIKASSQTLAKKHVGGSHTAPRAALDAFLGQLATRSLGTGVLSLPCIGTVIIRVRT